MKPLVGDGNDDPHAMVLAETRIPVLVFAVFWGTVKFEP